MVCPPHRTPTGQPWATMRWTQCCASIKRWPG